MRRRRALSAVPGRTILLTSSAASRTSASAVKESPLRGLALSDGLGEKEIISSMLVEKKDVVTFSPLHARKREPASDGLWPTMCGLAISFFHTCQANMTQPSISKVLYYRESHSISLGEIEANPTSDAGLFELYSLLGDVSSASKSLEYPG